MACSHSRPHSPFVSLSRLGLGTRKRKGSGDTGFPVQDSRTSDLHVCSHDVSKKNVWESRYVFNFRLEILCSKQPIKKNRINSKILCPQSHSFSRAKPAKRNERAVGREWPALRLFFFSLWCGVLVFWQDRKTHSCRIILIMSLRKKHVGVFLVSWEGC